MKLETNRLMKVTTKENWQQMRWMMFSPTVHTPAGHWYGSSSDGKQSIFLDGAKLWTQVDRFGCFVMRKLALISNVVCISAFRSISERRKSRLGNTDLIRLAWLTVNRHRHRRRQFRFQSSSISSLAKGQKPRSQLRLVQCYRCLPVSYLPQKVQIW